MKKTGGMFELVLCQWASGAKVAVAYLFAYTILNSFILGAWIELPLTILTVFIYIFSLYNSVGYKARKERTLVNQGQAEADCCRGLKAGILAQIPGLIIASSLILTNTPELAWQNSALRKLYFVLYSPFTGIAAEMEGSARAFYFLPIVLTPAISAAAYYIGFNQIRLLKNID